MEATRTQAGEQAVADLYTEYGRRIHHDRTLDFTATEALEAAGLDVSLAEAFDDDSWDPVLRDHMDDGLALAGDDIGTPLIAFDDDEGTRVGLFGPVISHPPAGEAALRLWDGFVAMATVPGFWEVKRTRTERPNFGPRP